MNLPSASALRGGGFFGGSHYAATKAVLGLTRALACEAVGLSQRTVRREVARNE